MSNQSDFSFIQINKSYSGALLNAIEARSRSKHGSSKKKREILASENPLMALISLAGDIAS
ncbi:hypothetical protein Q5692_17145 [Microcoleus sp. C2C3]|uniref:hypothetical protein n=1 Tax=unclassified Microcoleus TaxID=2642155 RepID=UPI002FD2C8CD